MAKTGPDIPGESWKETQGTCNVCGAIFSIGRQVSDGETKSVTDSCYVEACDGSATVTLVGRPEMTESWPRDYHVW
jgi:hypothetical protein